MKCVSACGCLLVEVKSLSQLHGQLRLRVMTLHLGAITWELLLGEVDGSIYWIYGSDVCYSILAVKRSVLSGCCFVLQSFACPHLSK